VAYCHELGLGADNNPHASWFEVMAAAGEQPMCIGGRAWCHWTAVRMGSRAAGYTAADALALMNPSPGYMGVSQVLDEGDYARLGPFSAVWIWPT
jgi:hypothetical protein